jgi:DNA-binding NarL/FixJ family response regulator
MNLRRDLLVDRPRVLVADDHGPMLATLVRLLSTEYEVVAALLDGPAVLVATARHVPDILVLDIAMPGMSGIAAARQLRDRGILTKVVFVTMHREREYVEESATLGAVGFVVKDRLVADLLPAVLEVLAGHTFVSPSVR